MLTRLRTYRALGFSNILRVAAYRLGVSLGIHPVLKIDAQKPVGQFFYHPNHYKTLPSRQDWRSTIKLFAHHEFNVVGIPNWHKNFFMDTIDARSNLPWHQIPDFDKNTGDIKTIWDLSRFDWLIAMAQRAAVGEANELVRLNEWLTDWVDKNPTYMGVNWKCGQEASIRVMHLSVAALMLEQFDKSEPGLLALVKAHLERISPTVSYAIGQSNNHGTSEAAALFIGGTWLSQVGVRKANTWAERGRKLLENRARVLIASDGSFSQYSTVYHRMVLDTYTLCEVWRSQWGVKPFSKTLIDRLGAATTWLESLVDPVSGDSVNLGANDGTQIIRLSDVSYRDFRPSIHRASLLFRATRANFGDGLPDIEAKWLSLDTNLPLTSSTTSRTFDDGGFHILRTDKAWAMLRYPRFSFRPAQADALHLDVWLDGKNILRDGGSFSYFHPAVEDDYFSSVRAHNTVEFDGRDQMLKISRFLYKHWLTTDECQIVSSTNSEVTAAAGYTDINGARHFRQIALANGKLKITDSLKGVQNGALLRWRLAPGNYEVCMGRVKSEYLTITIESDLDLKRCELSTGRESLSYLEEHSIPVLEVEVVQAGSITTVLEW